MSSLWHVGVNSKAIFDLNRPDEMIWDVQSLFVYLAKRSKLLVLITLDVFRRFTIHYTVLGFGFEIIYSDGEQTVIFMSVVLVYLASATTFLRQWIRQLWLMAAFFFWVVAASLSCNGRFVVSTWNERMKVCNLWIYLIDKGLFSFVNIGDLYLTLVCRIK